MADSQRKTAQLYDKSDTTTQYNAYLNANGTWVLDNSSRTVKLRCKGNTTYTISIAESSPIFRISEYSDYDLQAGDSSIILSSIIRGENLSQYTFTTAADSECLIFQGSYALYDSWLNSLMFVEGSTAKPYEPYGWVHSLRKLTTATEAIENPLYADGTAITSYTIKGNTTQSGTPTPSNPVDVNGVGVRTENLAPTSEFTNDVADTRAVLQILIRLYNGSSIAGSATYDVTEMGTLSFSSPALTSTPITRVYIKHNGTSRDIPILDVNVDYPNGQFQFTADYQSINPQTVGGIKLKNIMLNYGSTAKPYEPYGFKIPITNGQQTTNIYLGSTSSTRQIQKLVLTGNEGWTKAASATGVYYGNVLNNAFNQDLVLTTVCTHYLGQPNTSTVTLMEDMHCAVRSVQADTLYIRDTNIATREDWISYLQQQYANGTPVTVWYVLATAEAAAVNEPLMKIGDYVDTLSNAAQIPTIQGANSITVDTTVQPSEFTATWTGWHDSTVKEWDGNDWT